MPTIPQHPQSDKPQAISDDETSPYDILIQDKREASVPRRRKTDAPKKRQAQFFVTFCHWSMVALLAICLLTGMRIGWSYLESALGGPNRMWSVAINAIAPKGSLFGVNLIMLHVTCAWLLLLNAGIYVGYLFRSGASRRLRVTRRDVRALTNTLRSGGFWRNKAALWSANLLIYWVAFTAMGVLGLTGTALYRVDWGLTSVLGGYQTVRVLHGLAAYLFLPYVVLHTLLQWRFGTLWSIFKARLYRPHLKAGYIGLAIAVPLVGGLYVWNDLPTTLTIARLPGNVPAPVLDGQPHDPAWDSARAVTVRTVKGINNPHDHVDITVKALHDDQRVYFRFQWADPDVSAKRFPLLKTAHGWKVLQTGMEQSDEDVYYEDKLAMYITDVRMGSCAATCHLGEGARKGLHYTTGGEIGDVWHWKSVRTEPPGELTGGPGHVDDQYFGPPAPRPTDPKKRYSGGYFPDPKTGGGYRENFVKLDPDKPLAETYVRPIKLPPTFDLRSNPDPTTSEHGVPWWIHEAQGIPYTEEADTYPVGSLIPNILVAPLEGDRADVWSKASWQNGQWTLEVSRLQDTKSQYDVAFTAGKPVYITLAAFNRTQIHHSEHIKPVRVVFQP